jgi:hypothetical protein
VPCEHEGFPLIATWRLLWESRSVVRTTTIGLDPLRIKLANKAGLRAKARPRRDIGPLVSLQIAGGLHA